MEHHSPDLTKRITTIIYGVIGAFTDRAPVGLEESRHAPRVEAQGLEPPQRCSGNQPASFTFVNTLHNHTTSTSPASSSSRFPPRVHHHFTPSSSASPSIRSFSSTSSVKSKSTKMPVADVDDTVGFMTAARTFKLPQNYGSPAVHSAVDASSEQGSVSKADADFPADPFDHGATVSRDDIFAPSSPTVPGDLENNSGFEEFGVTVETPKAREASNVAGDFSPQDDTTVAGSAQPVGSDAVTPDQINDEQEDRTDLTTFKSWGVPVVRDKPAAKVRRIIINGLPTTWCSPAKVLSLVHGGIIESISISDHGTAHILFCDHEACQAFYDKYPNGIDLGRERRHTVFVEMGKDVDVVSTKLSFNLSVGSTRAVRAVGVDMKITMEQLVKIASVNGRKVEKILDSYVPGDARNVVFRFCNIEDAVRFRSALVRDADWEHCNVQYATDPCEFATGMHFD
ncbi:hypothetical protein BO94DRAFT_527430 [Aspergillus sclerotioniger CBS 115572]|uniref:Uncharacterized protein n=1 Tax=Aspergillus sclerotioniger CBS 115572 TaxID=1450535 RepID=A0A317V7H6_9EURO|nr:hypothetical protein BO94DRAFT_527430 [Aspergillus sclerotioniger CBS 115572]PWY69221.1 hypothetical protein BO94DRAFT_527430 [Aspergillus sclerotioniger CBS 115572]